MNVFIAKTHDRYAKRMKIRSSCFVVISGYGVVVLRAVQFDNQTRFVAEKVCDIAANYFLSAKAGVTKP